MRYLKAIFIFPSYHSAPGWQGILNFISWLFSWLIRLITRSRFSHAAVVLDLGEGDVIVEAIFPKVCTNPAWKYDDEPASTVIRVPVTEEQYFRAVAMAKSLVGHSYGIDDCLIGAIHDLLGDGAANIIKHIDDKGTVDCSAVMALVFRSAFPHFMAGHTAAEITPQKAYEAVKSLPGAEFIKEIPS